MGCCLVNLEGRVAKRVIIGEHNNYYDNRLLVFWTKGSSTRIMKEEVSASLRYCTVPFMIFTSFWLMYRTRPSLEMPRLWWNISCTKASGIPGAGWMILQEENWYTSYRQFIAGQNTQRCKNFKPYPLSESTPFFIVFPSCLTGYYYRLKNTMSLNWMEEFFHISFDNQTSV